MPTELTDLYLLRHGDAAPFASRDCDRELTAKGRVATQRVLAARLQSLSSVESIYASPYVRAQETAAIVAETLGLPFETSDFLTPDVGLIAASQFIGTLSGSVLLVTHQPLIGNLVDWLSGADRGRYFMNTSSMAYFRLSVLAGGCGDLRWLQHEPEEY